MSDSEMHTLKLDQPLRFNDESIAGPWRVLSPSGRTLVTLHSGGEVEFDPADLTDGARIFWNAVAVHSRRCTDGMVVDGDVLRDVIADATPDVLTQEAARDVAEKALDEAVRLGMTVLHGPNHQPRQVRS